MKAKVYFVKAKRGEDLESVREKTRWLLENAGLKRIIKKDELVALKLSFGEAGNTGHVDARHARFVVDEVTALKGKPFFTPQHDCGDCIIAINAKEIVLKAGKLEDKMYRRHSGYPGGLKEKKAKDVMATEPERAIIEAVSGMLPKNKLRKWMLRNFKVYAGPEHTHKGQNPEPINL